MVLGHEHLHGVHDESDSLLDRVLLREWRMLTDLLLELILSDERHEVIGETCEFVLVDIRVFACIIATFWSLGQVSLELRNKLK